MLTKLNLNNNVLKFCLAYELVKIFVKYEKLLFVTGDYKKEWIKLHKEYIWNIWFAFKNVFLWFLTSFVPYKSM